MFSRRKALNKRRHYSREFCNALVSDLDRAGFSSIEVLLPITSVNEGEANPISFEDLLARNRNYPALILTGRNPAALETIKVLFINRNSKSVFADHTFPNGESEPPQLYVQSPDPARAYSLFEFFYEYLNQPSVFRPAMASLVGVLSFATLFLSVVAMLQTGRLLIVPRHPAAPVWNVIVLIASVGGIFWYFSVPSGLWIKPRRELRLWYLANMALRGEFRDNPLVSLIVAVLGTVIGAWIVKRLGLL